jgi:hypothetical protein
MIARQTDNILTPSADPPRAPFPGRWVWEGLLRNFAVLSASDFGVPQKRQRLFIIGVRKDVGDAVGIDSDEAVQDVFPALAQVGVSIRLPLANVGGE